MTAYHIVANALAQSPSFIVVNATTQSVVAYYKTRASAERKVRQLEDDAHESFVSTYGR
jgi:hypothetical protein